MSCPNCTGDHLTTDVCLLGALLGVVADRGNRTDAQLATILAAVDADALWSDLGRVIDKLEDGEYSNEAPLIFRGNHGSIKVEAASGMVIDYSGTAQPESDDWSERNCECGDVGCVGYSYIARVDVEEWAAWRRDVLKLGAIDEDDILAVATWDHSGKHEVAELEWRRDAEASHHV